MAGTLTPYGRQQYLLSVHRPDLYAAPASLYFAITLAVPYVNVAGAELEEPDVSTSYTRMAYPLIGAAYWLPTNFGEIYNAQSRTFPELTSDSGLACGYAVVDAAGIGAGNVWAIGNIGEPYLLSAGISPFIDIGDILIGMYD